MIAPWLDGPILTGHSPSEIAAQPCTEDTKNLVGPVDIIQEETGAVNGLQVIAEGN